MSKNKPYEIYQLVETTSYPYLYRNIHNAVNTKYSKKYGGTPIYIYWWNELTNLSYTFPDFEHVGNGVFNYYINRTEIATGTLAYNSIKITIDLKELYTPIKTPYLNAGNGDMTYTLAKYKHCYSIRDELDPRPSGGGGEQYRFWEYRLPHYPVYESGGSIMPSNTAFTFGPTPTVKKVSLVAQSQPVEWNKNYEHSYIGPYWVLSENQTYAEYYVRSVYWWNEEYKKDINRLLTLSKNNHGAIIGFLSNNTDYVKLLILLVNYFMKQDGNNDKQEWIYSTDLVTNNSHNFYGTKIICDEKTRGIVLDIPRTRSGPVGRLFLPFIEPTIVYTPTLHRCDFEHFLWYFIPWEVDNAIKYLMLTDCEVADDNIEPNNPYKVKACIATRRGHTKDDMPDLSEDDIAAMNCFWGYGYHYRLDPNRLFSSSLIFKIDDLSTFILSEENLFNLIFEKTGVLFPIDGNTITSRLNAIGLVVDITLNSARATTYFLPTTISIMLTDVTQSIKGISNNFELVYGPDRDGWISEDDSIIDNSNYEVIDLYLTTYCFNFTKNSLNEALLVNYDMLKLFKIGDVTYNLPDVLVQYVLHLLSEKPNNHYWFFSKNTNEIPSNAVVNLAECKILYNGKNTIVSAGKYHTRTGLDNILVLEPTHRPISNYYTRYIVINYED